ncbi:hypothetical protein [Roseibium suaedae]|uniref:Uncharacterized protein n=1 Tax=Roseibium suaedae TaxID=735517 RepID=A0A1M7KZR8_9HYPH|nr:hypothetical protein [Roseibium suaedae]SHM71087.1 hypothetical protein SAMN05444272_3027 [Roseibium suaedae]
MFERKRTGAAVRNLLGSAGLIACGVLAGCASQSEGDAQAWYGAHNGVAPKADRIYVCHGFGCTYKTPVHFSGKDLARLKSILQKGAASPEAERKAISAAVSWQERRAGPIVGSSNDIGGLDMHNAGVRGQMDCIDESTNTNSLLLLAQRHGYLKHHTVSSPVARGFFLDGRYPHASATVKEKQGGAVYAIDSWPTNNGEAPVISPLDVWMARQSG